MKRHGTDKYCNFHNRMENCMPHIQSQYSKLITSHRNSSVKTRFRNTIFFCLISYSMNLFYYVGKLHLPSFHSDWLVCSVLCVKLLIAIKFKFILEYPHLSFLETSQQGQGSHYFTPKSSPQCIRSYP